MDLDWIAFNVPIKLWNPAYNDNLKTDMLLKLHYIKNQIKTVFGLPVKFTTACSTSG